MLAVLPYIVILLILFYDITKHGRPQKIWTN